MQWMRVLEDHVDQDLAPLKRVVAAEGEKGYWRAGIKMTQGFEQTCFYAKAGEKDKAKAISEGKYYKSRIYVIDFLKGDVMDLRFQIVFL